MLRVILLQKAYNPGYTYLRNGKIVRVEAFSDRRVKRATAANHRDDRTGDLFGDAGPTIDKPLKELIDDHEKVIDALESQSKATRQAAADEQKEHLEAYREQLDTAAKVRLIEGSMDEFGGYEVGGKRYTGEDAEMLVDEAREIAFATGKRVEDALLQIVPAEQLKADEPITGPRAVAQRQVNAANRFVESVTEQFGLSKEEAGRAWDYYVAHKLVHADPVTGQYQLKDGRFWDAEVLRQAGRQADPAAELRALWNKQGVPKERQDALIAQIADKAAPGAKVGPFDVPPAPKVSAEGYEYRDQTEPKALFRAVSPEEWAQIQRDGEIRGGLNTFNGFDPRREVFFGDVLNDELIAQGEDVARRAEYAIQQSALQKRYQRLQARLGELNAQYEAQRTELIEDGYTSAAAGMHPSMQAISKKRRALQDSLADVQAKAREQIQQIIATKRTEDAERGYSSVVLETQPVSGGRIYSGRHSGMRGDEYGLDPGAVKLTDVVRVHYVKDRKVLRAEGWPQQTRAAEGPVLPKLSARGLRAHSVLQSGGYFRKQLESQYRGGEKFETRLHDASGQVVPGIGYKTWAELSDAGLLNSRPVPRSTVWRSEWGLREKPLTKAFPRVKSVRQVSRMS